MRTNPQSGFTLLEVLIAATILTVIMASMIVGMQKEAKNLGELVTTTHRERAAQVVMHRIEQELEFAAGIGPAAWTSGAVSAGAGTLSVDSTLGFPPTGTLLIEPDGISLERADYTDLNRITNSFTGLDRGAQCTTSTGHPTGVRVFWAGGATALENQLAPPVSAFDGQANGPNGPIFYRGDGTGFSFRVPTDPAGGTDYFDATGIRWGSKVNGGQNANGWSCIQFVAVRQITELAANIDLNLDGDLADTYDLGQMRFQTWDAANNGVPNTDTGLSPPIVLQEQCNYGGDLDADGFQDPIFIWDPTDGSLRIQMFILSGMHNERGVLSRTATTLYLRNGAL